MSGLVPKQHFSEFKRVVRSILLNEGKVFPLFKGYIPPWRRCLFAIGSILDHANYKTIVWGSGFREFTSKYRHSKILAVRGKLSLDILPSKMDKKNIALGDPALLLPLIYHSQSKKKVKVGIVPHFVDYAFSLIIMLINTILLMFVLMMSKVL